MHYACTDYDAGVSKVLQVRNVPDDVHAVLVQRAERRGVTLSAYLRELVTAHARTATLDEVLDSLPPLSMSVSAQEIVDDIHAEREERESRWS